MLHTIKAISDALDIPFEGDGSIRIESISSAKFANSNQLVVAINDKYTDELSSSDARAALMFEGADWQSFGLQAALLPKQSRLKMSEVFNLFEKINDTKIEINQTAIISKSANIGKNVAIGAFSVIGDHVTIENDTIIENNVYISSNCSVGEGSIILSGVKIGPGVSIGEKFRCSYNSVIGSDGFSFVSEADDSLEEIRSSLGKSRRANQSTYYRIASFGSVKIGSNVEIGSNCSVDSGTINDTIIGDGSKLDNLVHIGHNVIVGRDTLLCGQVGIAGSAEIGDRVVLAGQCGVGDHTKVGNDVIAGGATKIFSNVPNGRVILGHPAMKMDENIKLYKSLRRLPRFMEKINNLISNKT
ncbi:MAG: UDP-3-O-(3-hydroxymyristoyl)glucosamine N-acyltransferase [Euryarchaeota archaeon]|nr:UDP-3-O-(3-hydroxymyristoyl)glucosamine N-acyltransferase [Euryarchaeota archaeon]